MALDHEYNYYKAELNRAGENPTIKIGQSKYLSLNKESAEAIINWLLEKELVSDYQVTKILRKRGNAITIFSVEDVLSRNSNLSEEQAKRVLESVDNNADPEYGMTWQTIDETITMLFSEVPESTEEEDPWG